ncbi:MAG: VOC family protein [Chloroflexi bacterium]|nr:VOC family protein [Chloroflexota bacterium]
MEKQSSTDGAGMFYHMQQIRELDVAALYQQMPDEKEMGLPSHWRTYFAVNKVEDTIEKVKKAGGTAIMGPMDVFDVGRMAVFQDPQGAVFSVWEAKTHIGYRLVSEPGALTWNELLTTDVGKATEFYKAALGMTSEKMPVMDYTMLSAEGQQAAGIMQIRPEMGPMPPNWSVYFSVADINKATKKVTSLGGKVISPIQDVPNMGRFAMVQDPQGAMFGIFQGA